MCVCVCVYISSLINDTDMYLNFNVQAMSKFIAASRQATELDKARLLL